MTEQLKAGRSLDALVAEKVMGLTMGEREWPCGFVPDGCEREVYDPTEKCDWENDAEFAERRAQHEKYRDSWLYERHPVYFHLHESGWKERRIVPFYSTSIEDAWKVVEKMREDHGFWVDLQSSGLDPKLWKVTMHKSHPAHLPAPRKVVEASFSAPEAICLAALKSVSVTEEKVGSDV